MTRRRDRQLGPDEGLEVIRRIARGSGTGPLVPATRPGPAGGRARRAAGPSVRAETEPGSPGTAAGPIGRRPNRRGGAMNASDLYKAGRLGGGHRRPGPGGEGVAPATRRSGCSSSSCSLFAGDLDRARRQIEAVEYKDAGARRRGRRLPQAAGRRAGRRDLFARGMAPGFFGEPPEHMRLRLDAVNRLREGRPAEAAEALGRANEAIPPSAGRLNGQPFQSFRDADDLFAGVLEVMAHGRYFWVGLEQVRLLTMNAPRFPRDLLFIPAHLELEDEQGDIFIPALYPGSHEHADDQVKLGRMTDWKELDGGAMLGRRPAYVPPRRRRDRPARMAGMAVGSRGGRSDRGGPRRPWPGSRRRMGSGPRCSTASSTPNRRGRAGGGATASIR